MSDNPIDRMFDALAAGDIPAVRACFTPDGKVWHCFDGITQDMDEAAKGWEGLVGFTASRIVDEVRRQATAEGFVQQHVFTLKFANGDSTAWHVAAVVKTEGNLISRFDEYIDRGGSFKPA